MSNELRGCSTCARCAEPGSLPAEEWAARLKLCASELSRYTTRDEAVMFRPLALVRTNRERCGREGRDYVKRS